MLTHYGFRDAQCVSCGGKTAIQREVGAGYFDDVSTVISGGLSSTLALEGSTEEEQF